MRDRIAPHLVREEIEHHSQVQPPSWVRIEGMSVTQTGFGHADLLLHVIRDDDRGPAMALPRAAPIAGL